MPPRIPTPILVNPTLKEVEQVAESLGTVALTTTFDPVNVSGTKKESKARKWSRKKATAPRKSKAKSGSLELGKRQLIEVLVTDGTIDEARTVDKKHKGNIEMVDIGNINKEVVLEDQHRRSQ